LRWREGYGRSEQEAVLRDGGASFSAAETAEFSNAQIRTAGSLVATIATHSHLLVMAQPERETLLKQIGDFLRQQPETADGEFTLPLITIAVRATTIA
jgi:hypothetical protein